MKIQDLELSLIRPYENNAKKHDKKQIDNVAESIKQFGFVQPIVLTNDNIIVIGHCRYEAAKKLKLKRVPCLYVDDLTDEQIKKLRNLDNKLNESEWDLDLLAIDITGLDFDGFDIDWELPSLTSKEIEEDNFDCDKAFEEISHPIVKRGDIWKLGDHYLMCGDATLIIDINRLVNNNKIDLIFTDPPYGMNAVSKSGVLSKNYKSDILNDDSHNTAINSFLVCKKLFENAKQVWWGANYYTEVLPSAECWIVWDKNNGGSDQTDCELGWTNFRSVVRQFTLASEKVNRLHPTQKPIKLIEQIFNKFDKDRAYNTVLDLFGGSGSTLIACEQLNRKCYMMELD